MGKSSEVVASRIQQALIVAPRVWEHLCDECEDVCWSAEVVLFGTISGEGYTSYAFMRDHMSQGRALKAVGMWMMGHGHLIAEREDRAWLLEHQPTLW